MKRFLKCNVCNTQAVRGMVVVGMLATTSACSTGNGAYIDSNTQNARDGKSTNVVFAGESAVINQAGSKKVNSPDFLTKDPYTALSPDEMIRLYGSK